MGMTKDQLRVMLDTIYADVAAAIDEGGKADIRAERPAMQAPPKPLSPWANLVAGPRTTYTITVDRSHAGLPVST